VPAQVPHQVLTVGEVGDAASVEHIAAAIQDVDAFGAAAAVLVPIEQIQRELVGVGIAEQDVQADRGR